MKTINTEKCDVYSLGIIILQIYYGLTEKHMLKE